MDNLDKDFIYDQFLNGKTIQQIADENNKTWSSIYQIIGGRLPHKYSFSEIEEKRICYLYLSGKSCPKIAEIYKVGHKCISNVLKKHNIKCDQKNMIRKYSFDENYFDNIDTPDKAYILGLLFADGNNSINKSTISLSLQEYDKDILYKIKDAINYNGIIKDVDVSNRVYGNGYISKNMCSLNIYSKRLCQVLSDKGMVKNKSLILEYPNYLPQDLNRHFLRGYFDGDGSIYKSNERNYNFTITSTFNFCKDALSIMRRELNIGGNIYDASNHNGITKVVVISGRNQCKTVTDWFYNDSDLFLQRKYDRYVKYFYSDAA